MANLRYLLATFSLWKTMFDCVRPKNMDNIEKTAALNMKIIHIRKGKSDTYHIEARKIKNGHWPRIGEQNDRPLN